MIIHIKNKYMTSYGIFPADNWETATEALIPEINRIAKILHLVDGQMDIQYIMGGRWTVDCRDDEKISGKSYDISNS